MRRVWAWLDRHIMGLILTLLVLTLLGTVLYPSTLRSIPAGEVGVIWRRFGGGTDVKTVLGEGLHVMWPFDRLTTYEIRMRRVENDVRVLTAEGVAVDMKVAVRFRVEPENVGLLHKYVGPEFLDRLVMPAVAARLRAVIGTRRPDQIYAVLQNAIDLEQDIENYVRERLQDEQDAFNGTKVTLQIIDVLITGVKLPDYVNAAIERKAEQEQAALEYTYRLERERMEAERKIVEANGIRQFQEIIASSLTEPLLRWRGVEATEKLANSPNAKILLFGAPQTGLPLMLGPIEGLAPVAKPEGRASGGQGP